MKFALMSNLPFCFCSFNFICVRFRGIEQDNRWFFSMGTILSNEWYVTTHNCNKKWQNVINTHGNEWNVEYCNVSCNWISSCFHLNSLLNNFDELNSIMKFRIFSVWFYFICTLLMRSVRSFERTQNWSYRQQHANDYTKVSSLHSMHINTNLFYVIQFGVYSLC